MASDVQPTRGFFGMFGVQKRKEEIRRVIPSQSCDTCVSIQFSFYLFSILTSLQNYNAFIGLLFDYYYYSKQTDAVRYAPYIITSVECSEQSFSGS